MEKLKARETDGYPQEAIADDEPRYLRRQKPVQIKQRKFGKRAWKFYFRVFVLTLAAAGGAVALYGVGDFLLTSRRMALLHPQQIELTGNHYVARTAALEIFAADRGKSVLRIPLEQRRRQLEAIPWIERATVRRALPNRIQVDITERTPVAFLRQGTDLALLDSSGVILEKPLEGDFQFPVVTGLSAEMPLDDRAQRMKLFSEFLQQIELAKPGAGMQVSEVDLSDAADVRVTLSDLPPAGSLDSSSQSIAPPEGPVTVHFGDRDFQNRFRLLLENIAQWRATAGRVESIDLRFSHEVVVNPESSTPAAKRVKMSRPARSRK